MLNNLIKSNLLNDLIVLNDQVELIFSKINNLKELTIADLSKIQNHIPNITLGNAGIIRLIRLEKIALTKNFDWDEKKDLSVALIAFMTTVGLKVVDDRIYINIYYESGKEVATFSFPVWIYNHLAKHWQEAIDTSHKDLYLGVLSVNRANDTHTNPSYGNQSFLLLNNKNGLPPQERKPPSEDTYNPNPFFR